MRMMVIISLSANWAPDSAELSCIATGGAYRMTKVSYKA
jgi:hypothetical protein